ncbi:sensor histidine kinase [Nesterenkonia flava]|uniref:Sensor histidine kinase n=1 Tax=Nesterenkonia flava TaxID=469799 RepID=A0ABU1FSB7_9MICC|nr:sensor histidine kinase [Nesterenkonia flava]MDR5711518.1 sensor histidine kinase [Nesterenkonia flava]
MTSIQPERDGSRWRPDDVAGIFYASVWLIFLTGPVIAAWHSSADQPWPGIALGATAVFVVVYLGGAITEFDYDRGPSPLRLVVLVLLLLGLAGMTVPAVGPWALTFTPYVGALLIFSLPLRTGAVLCVLVWALPTLGTYLISESEIWALLGPGIGVLFVTAMRLMEHFDTRTRRAEVQLRAARERDSIARDVHDVLGHSLTVLLIKAQVARRLMETDPGRSRTELEDIESLARESLDQVRSTVTRLKAPQLPGELEVARTALEAAGVRAEIHQGEGLDTSAGSLLAWALREAVTNVVRHSGASSCRIEVDGKRLRVADDGVGLGQQAEGNGLTGLRRRAEESQGRLLIGRAYPEMEGTSAERPGTAVEVIQR